MFVQSESFDLFTAQVLHFTRHSPPITRATVALPASQCAVRCLQPFYSARLNSTHLHLSWQRAMGQGEAEEKSRGKSLATTLDVVAAAQRAGGEGERAREGGREKQKYFPSDFNRSRDFFTCHAPVYTHTHTHTCACQCACVCQCVCV